jgi:4-amino-4-deoxy-L-arabinose transferase-like glycosyltransferase
MRATAAVVAALVVAATMLLALRLARGRITAAAAGLLAATVGASPFVESFTLSGELLASLPAVLSLLCFCAYLRGRRVAWLLLAGALTGLAVLIKQSAFDAGLAAVVFLLWRERRRGLAPAGLLITSACLPIAVAAANAARLNEWIYAIIGYRFDGDSLLSGSVSARAHQLWLSLPPAAKGLGLLAVLAAFGWRRAPLLARIWLGAALIGVLGGGNFHPHYYLQLVPPLSLLAAVGLRTVWQGRPRRAVGLALAGAAISAALVLPVALASPATQAREIWPHDPHLVHDQALARYVRAHTRAREPVLALWADADLYYLADRRPAVRYLWARNVASVPGALAAVHRALATRRAALVVLVQAPGKLDPSGRTARLLHRGYLRVARVRGVAVYRSRIQRKTSATTSPSTAT